MVCIHVTPENEGFMIETKDFGYVGCRVCVYQVRQFCTNFNIEIIAGTR